MKQPSNANEFNPPEKWEVLGALFGYLAVAKDIPTILRMLGIPKLVPSGVKKVLLSWNGNADSWLLWFGTWALLVVLAYQLWKSKPPLENAARTDEEELEQIFKKVRIVQTIRSLGLNILRGYLLSFVGVNTYETFKMPVEWGSGKRDFSYIDRLSYSDRTGQEFRYSKNFETISVRTHSSTDSRYGPFDRRPVSWRDFRVLVFASNVFPLWLLVYLFRRGFCCIFSRRSSK